MGDDLLYEIEGRFVKIEQIGAVPAGERTNFHYMADVDGPQIQGKLRGIDYSRTVDGVVHVDIREILTTEDGEKVYITRSGRSESQDDDGVLIRGDGQAETAAERLAWLNDAAIGWEARLKRDSVDYTAKVFRR